MFKRFTRLKCRRQIIMSSIITSVGYSYQENVIEIEFKRNSKVWRYIEVPTDIWEEFNNSTSKGKFFLNEIRDKYRRKRVR